jgi:hypothetical protein
MILFLGHVVFFFIFFALCIHRLLTVNVMCASSPVMYIFFIPHIVVNNIEYELLFQRRCLKS